MVWYGQVWSSKVKYGPVWSGMVLYGPVWSHMVPHGPVWYCNFPYGPVNPDHKIAHNSLKQQDMNGGNWGEHKITEHRMR